MCYTSSQALEATFCFVQLLQSSPDRFQLCVLRKWCSRIVGLWTRISLFSSSKVQRYRWPSKINDLKTTPCNYMGNTHALLYVAEQVTRAKGWLWWARFCLFVWHCKSDYGRRRSTPTFNATLFPSFSYILCIVYGRRVGHCKKSLVVHHKRVDTQGNVSFIFW